MRKNFRYLFEDRKFFGFYSDEIFVSLIAGLLLAAPIYILANHISGVLGKLSGLLLLSITFAVASFFLSVMRLIRGNKGKSIYVRIIGRNEAPKTLKGFVTKIVLYAISIGEFKGKNRIRKTQNYSP